tara:strand:+ start:338 stop:727 length:390 start_codon:yes stop_codon:yes gene_type:complete
MIDIYTNETCPYCKQIKEELTKNNIEFNERLTKDWPAKWQDLINLTGMANLPTISREENIYIPGRDFSNPQHLVNLINNKHHDYGINKETFEKIKTLNYNIHNAFNMVDQLLKQIENKLNIKDEHKSTD